jgi:hypothetical protein
MYADPKKVRLRRLKRRLKASVSIVLATAAGVFLACQRRATGGSEPVGPSPYGPDARTGPEAGEVEIPPADAGSIDDSPVPAPERERDAAVDVDEHRKGMPVRDNLLE